MPITYSVDHSRRVVLVSWTGDVTARDLRSHWKKMLADPEAFAMGKSLADLRMCNLLLTGSELWSLVDKVAIPLLKGRDWKTALVVARSEQYGASRQYQAFASRYSTDAIFEDYDKALAWILAQ